MEKFLDKFADIWLTILVTAVVIMMAFGAGLLVRDNPLMILFFVGVALTAWTVHRLDKIEKRKKKVKR